MLAMCVLVCISLILFFLHLLVKSVRQTANVMSEMLYPYVASSSILLPLFLKTQVVEEAKALSKKAKQSLQISSSPPVLLKISENGSSSKSL